MTLDMSALKAFVLLQGDPGRHFPSTGMYQPFRLRRMENRGNTPGKQKYAEGDHDQRRGREKGEMQHSGRKAASNYN
ncbi:hypothetical protein SAMN05216412_1017 [Nitrosospira multiformis]|uniref:Uncharacterized protein n=1 Tax=Nitrosospira multiformis TaxID=1231 RepID=A0A1H9Y2N5_9PROT|nr:hypothetical protein SAMN05216412_1017 [Nitrosospira multiformis]